MNKIRLIVLLLIVSCLLPVISCSGGYNVRFYAVSPDGQVLLDQTVKASQNKEIIVPELTPPEGYRFKGWTLNGEIYDFKGENAGIMNSDAEFVALFEKKEVEYLHINYESEKTGKEVITISRPLHDTGTLYENGRYYTVYEVRDATHTSFRILEGNLSTNRWGRDTVAVDYRKLADNYGMTLDGTIYNWAPDIVKYNGKYYIIGTYWCNIEGHDYYYDTETESGEKVQGHKASIIYECDTPTGTYKPISYLCTSRDSVLEIDAGKLGHPTQAGKSTIDATLYVDDDGQPWLVYCDEWCNYASMKGKVGAAKLSEDLTHFISEPIILFTANDPTIPYSSVTDSPFLYKCDNGDLLCLWSNFRSGTDSDYAYCVLVSRNKSGKVDEGKWEFDYAIYDGSTKTLSDGCHYGGHENIIMNSEGQLFLTLHIRYSNGSHASFIPIHEAENGRLVWGYDTVNKIVHDRSKDDSSSTMITKMAEGPFDSCSVEYTTQMDSDIFAGLYVETKSGWVGLKCNYESGNVIVENSDGLSEKYQANVGYRKKVKFRFENLVGDGEFKIYVNSVYSEELTKAFKNALGDQKIMSLSFYSSFEGESGNGVVASCTDYKVKGIRS